MCVARVRDRDLSSRHRLGVCLGYFQRAQQSIERSLYVAQLPTCHRRAPASSRRIWGESAVVHRWLTAQAPAYYYYTAADDSTYGYDDSAYAYGYDDAYGHAQCTKSNIVAARPRHC